MCSPLILEKVRSGLSRRQMLGAASAAAAAGLAARLPAAAQQATPVAAPQATPVASAPGGLNLQLGSYTRVQDLTHTITPNSPLYPAGYPQPEWTPLKTYEQDGFYANILTYVEHTGTHLDAPAHFVEGMPYSNELPVQQFFAPLAVIDISGRAGSDPDAQLMPDDILAWEAANGPLPAGALVAMNSGWSSRINDPAAFINQDADGALHFPGVHPDATTLLVEERDIVGLGVDTLSLDFGGSTDFGTHFALLGAGKYGLEVLASLYDVPAAGALVIVGGPKFERGSGGPSRVMALF